MISPEQKNKTGKKPTKQKRKINVTNLPNKRRQVNAVMLDEIINYVQSLQQQVEV